VPNLRIKLKFYPITTLEEILIRLKHLEIENAKLRSRNQFLEVKLIHLESQIEELKRKKNSSNSSIPPSQDPNRTNRNTSLRKKGGKKNGGQTGHQGKTLEFSTNPDEIVELKPDTCHNCGKGLDKDSLVRGETRQVIDIPPLYTITTEYRTYEGLCSCGCATAVPFPSYVKPGISYGPNIEAMIAYLSVRQFVSMVRIQEFFSGIYNLSISQGTIQNKLKSFHEKCMVRLQGIKDELKTSKWVGTDETWITVNGKKAWFWVWRNAHAVYMKFSSDRKQQTIFEEFATGLENTILVHDRYAAHFNTKVQSHQLCTAHLVRDLNAIIELKQSDWPLSFKHLLLDALELNRKMKQNPKASYQEEISQIKTRAATLLEEPPEKHKQKLRAFIKAMKKYKDYLFKYLDEPDVPPDNNISERAIRNSKVKLKVAGQFKTSLGAEIFACIRSVVDSNFNNELNVFQRFSLIAMEV
jgi:transposase